MSRPIARAIVGMLGGVAVISAGIGYLVWRDHARELGWPQGALVLTPEGIAVSGRRYAVWIEDVVADDVVRKLRGHDRPVKCVAVDAAGRTVASGSYDGTVRVFDLPSGRERLSIPHEGSVTSVAISPDGSRLASVSGGGVFGRLVRVFDATTGREVASRAGDRGVVALGFRPDGRRLALSWSRGRDTGVAVWDLESGAETAALTDSNLFMAIAYDPTGRRIAAAGARRVVEIVDADTGKRVLGVTGHDGRVDALAYDREGRRLASGDEDGNVFVLDAANGERLASFPQRGRSLVGVTALAFSTDGRRLFVAHVPPAGGWVPRYTVHDGVPPAPPHESSLEAPDPAGPPPGAPR